jgi:FkbM family methyltransferase
MAEGFTLYYPPGSYLGECVHGGTYEDGQTALVKNTVGPDWLFIDVGAGIGYYTLLAAKLGCRVQAYEPRKSNYDALVAGVREGGFTGSVRAIRLAVGDHAGEVALGINPVNDGDNRIATLPGWATETLCQETLDDALPFLDAQPEHTFIKMDVQGSELAVLRGAKRLIEQVRPIMLIEDAPRHVELAGETETLREVLTRLNYDFLEVDPREKFCDLWAVPRT